MMEPLKVNMTQEIIEFLDKYISVPLAEVLKQPAKQPESPAELPWIGTLLAPTSPCIHLFISRVPLYRIYRFRAHNSDS